MKKLSVKSVRDIGPQLTKNKHEMIGQDGAFSIPLNGNETLFYFGDTLIGERAEGESLWYPGGKPVGPKDMSGIGKIKKMINNTGLILYGNSVENGLINFEYITDENGNIIPLIPLNDDEDPDEIRIWCLHGVKLGEKIYLFFIKVRMIEEGIMPVNFELLGSGMASAKFGDWNFKRIYSNNSDLFWKEDEPKFASAILKSHLEDWLYLYGVIQQNFVQNCYLARVKQSDLENFNKYEYFCGSENWSKDIRNAIPVFTGMPNELSVSWNEYLNCYLAVHSLDLTGKIVGRTSETPWGPWSEPVTLHVVQVDRKTDLPYPVLIYAGKEHPSLSKDNGRKIYITYIEFEEYYPHLIEVELD